MDWGSKPPPRPKQRLHRVQIDMLYTMDLDALEVDLAQSVQALNGKSSAMNKAMYETELAKWKVKEVESRVFVELNAKRKELGLTSEAVKAKVNLDPDVQEAHKELVECHRRERLATNQYDNLKTKVSAIQSVLKYRATKLNIIGGE